MYRIMNTGTSEYVEKKSRFLGYAYDVSSPDAATEKIAALRKEHYNARHVCFAWQIDGVLRSSDDGEPQGTAGHPIADVVTHRELEHCLIAVVRYFGGTLLGTGGLTRAYAEAASAAADAASRMVVRQGFTLYVTLDYNDYGKAGYFFNENHIPQTGVDYGASVTVNLMVPSDLRAMTDKTLAEITAGKASPKWGDETSYGLYDGQVILLS
ncbi:MAG: YigZ family protein [Lachnospiraceae bacterium]|nr:YigZ family protein [Lachnospiraceae bacterium]